METNDSLRDLDRAAARPFTSYPAAPWWFAPLMGAHLAAIVAALFLIFGGNRIAGIIVEVIAILSLFFLTAWYRKRLGMWPQTKEAPTEIRRVFRRFYLVIAVALALIVVLAFFGPPAVTVVVTFLVFTALVWAYERKVYPAAAARVRARLA